MLALTFIISTLLISIVKCHSIFDEHNVLKESLDINYNISGMFSTISPYVKIEECTPIKAWVLIRHGAKYPSNEIMENVNKHLKEIIKELENLHPSSEIMNNDDKRSKAITKDSRKVHPLNDKNEKIMEDVNNNKDKKLKNHQYLISHLYKWQNIFINNSGKSLNTFGESMITDLGTRFETKLSKLVQALKIEEIKVLSSNKERCINSSQHFLNGFLSKYPDKLTLVKINSSNVNQLKLNKPSKEKIKINIDIKEDITTNDYFNKYCLHFKTKINKLLFPDANDEKTFITDNMVMSMYYACAYGYNFENDDGNLSIDWCLVFELYDLKLLENMFDIQYFYKNGYHLKENSEVGNEITQDILNFLKNNDKFKLFVGHTSNILSVITRFNLFRDDTDLTIDNINKMVDRKWRTSCIVPTGANISIVVYNCTFDTITVSLYVNEKPIKIFLGENEWCIKCPLEKFTEMIESFFEKPKEKAETDAERKRQ